MSESPSPVIDEPVRSAAVMLREAREAKGLSQEHIAQELYLTPIYIQHIDNGEFDKVAKQAFIKGYLRSYAKLVGLDGDEVIRVYQELENAPEPVVEIRGVTAEPVGPTNFTGPVLQTGLIGLAAVLLIGLIVWAIFGSDDEAEEPIVAMADPMPEVVETEDYSSLSYQPESIAQMPVVEADTEEATTEEVAVMSSGAVADDVADDMVDEELMDESQSSLVSGSPVFDRLMAERSSSQATGNAEEDADEPLIEDDEVAQPEAPIAVTETSESVIEASADASGADVVEEIEETVTGADSAVQAAPEEVDPPFEKDIVFERNREGETNLITVTADGGDELQFVFSEECWVEIIDSDGVQIYGDLNRDGDLLTVRGKAPFEILFGNAPAVTMEYNSEAFDLEPHTTRVNTAKVRVGS